MKLNLLLAVAVSGLLFTACNNNSEADTPGADSTVVENISEEAVNITLDTLTLNSMVAYGDDTTNKKPIVLIVPEWWGLDDYIRSRARQLAEMGYFAVAVDMYGNGRIAGDPGQAMAYATPFYQDPTMALGRLQAALNKAKTYPHADSTKSAAIGYCFGGAMVLNSAKLGLPVNGVVSFHGGLEGVPPSKDLLKADILVCHGAADGMVPDEQVALFKKQMDSLNLSYTFKEYPGATHAFTNPQATENGKKFDLPIEYNAAADSASWKDMHVFFGRIF